MTQVLVRFKQANSRKVPNTSATPKQVLVLPLMGLTLERPPHLPQPAEGDANKSDPAMEGSTNGITPISTVTTSKTTPTQ